MKTMGEFITTIMLMVVFMSVAFILTIKIFKLCDGEKVQMFLKPDEKEMVAQRLTREWMDNVEDTIIAQRLTTSWMESVEANIDASKEEFVELARYVRQTVHLHMWLLEKRDKALPEHKPIYQEIIDHICEESSLFKPKTSTTNDKTSCKDGRGSIKWRMTNMYQSENPYDRPEYDDISPYALVHRRLAENDGHF